MLMVLDIIFVDVFQSTPKNYHLFLLLSIVLWDFFTKGTSMGLSSIISKPGLVRQVYIPREILIFSSSITALIWLCLNLGCLVLS
jgi:lipopolysaccharide transport system permease protein